MGKNLILYFSRNGDNLVGGLVKTLEKGNTEYCAEFIQKAAGGDLFKIEPYIEYDEDYYACMDEATAEQNRRARPDLLYYLNRLDGYDNVFVCGPCWWGTYPMPVFTQIERLDWRGKKVFPLVTHEGSGLGSCVRDLQRFCRGAVFGPGLAVRGTLAPDSEKTVTDWVVRCLEAAGEESVRE
ncbi:MAG: flavodoxin [Firmicutes bacterium]|nr:flavodoxin [Bacillota bacterium]